MSPCEFIKDGSMEMPDIDNRVDNLSNGKPSMSNADFAIVANQAVESLAKEKVPAFRILPISKLVTEYLRKRST